ncbi:MAG TPA: hypothetical protein VFP97_03380 [Chitinophagaceae bacterium]|nr:hypothetical protein [Chitinophagaceae bacterium]
MRTIFFFLFIFCLSTSLFAQNPSAKEIEAQKQETLRDAKQEVADLKKEIAKAKLEKEDPASIKEMEKQLATLEQMVSMLERNFGPMRTQPQTTSSVKVAEPKYVSPFTPINVKRPIAIPTEKEATDQLFWYKGKKIDANTIITTSGTVVRYDRTNSKLIYEPSHQPGPDTTYYGLLNTLKQTREIKNLFASHADAMMNSFFMYPQIQGAYDEFDLMSGRFYHLADNTHNVNRPTARVDIRMMIENLENYVKNLPGVKKIILPPKNRVGKCLCEVINEAADYDEELRAWISIFFEEELEIIHRVADIFDEIATEPGPNSYKTYDFEFEPYLGTALIRANYKLEELLKEYESKTENIVLEDGLVYAKRNLEHWVEKYDLKVIGTAQGGTYSKSQALFKQVKDAVFSNTFDDYILVKKAKKEFNIVFDYLFYASHEYNKKLLSPGYKVNDNIKKWLESLEDYNRFTLTVKTEFEYVPKTEDKTQIWNVKGEFQSQNLIVSLGVEECFFNLRITDANYRDRNGDEEKLKIPLAVKNGAKQYGEGDAIPYTGPSNAMMLFPRFKLSFCGDGSEVKLDLLSYTQADINKHRSDDPTKVFTTDMLAYANRIFLGLVKTHSNVDDLINTAGKMMDMNNAKIAQSTGNPKLDKMKMDYGMNLKRYELLYHLAAATHTEKTIIKLGKLSPQGSPILGPNPIDLFDKSEDKDLKMTYAYITLELTHTPK